MRTVMSLPLFLRKTACCCSLAGALAGAAAAQASYSTNGGEFALAGSLAGDQVRPQLSVGPSGGYLVWEDNSLSTNGTRVRAIALGSHLDAVSAPFRVDQGSLGEQGRPRVALLKNGGAVFVWEGGKPGFQHVYARFVSSSNTWASGDQLVGGATNHFQNGAAVAVLTNGNAVIVWASYARYSSSSMLDVYGQLYSPEGKKIGSEFLVNQFTSYNQRTPSVAALSTGGFIVAWVSEQQRVIPAVVSNAYDTFTSGGSFQTAKNLPRPSVDVYARAYTVSGGVVGGAEFHNNSGRPGSHGPGNRRDGSNIIAAISVAAGGRRKVL